MPGIEIKGQSKRANYRHGGRIKKSMGGGLYENIHKKRARIAAGSGETMAKAGDSGRPTAKNFKESAKTAKKT
jgi:hypothetical protein